MKRLDLGILVVAFATLLSVTGCSSGSDSTTYEAGALPQEPGTSTSTVNISAGGDVNFTQTIVSGGTYYHNESGTLVYQAGEVNSVTLPDGGVVDVPDEVSGDFSAAYSQEDCAANGYFFCPISQQCMNLPASGSSCSM